MPSQPLDALRLAVMQEWLPLGLAVVDRARRGGVGSVVEGFTQAEDPLDQLRQEGEPAARQLRDSLDRLQPGLGNPVMTVQVRDLEQPPAEGDLQGALARIGERLTLLEQRLGAEP
ncbi:hypothetical protein [Vulcanococcus sp.]|jgi:hypothetical protein|uniref:hypothetical protein n=1 Tax=Vulcanococcus sp. TaxID=2856995 RepID=UPI0037D9A1AA